MRVLIFLAAGLLLAGCRSDREAARQPPRDAADSDMTSPADKRPVIVAFGDSLTAGLGVDAGKGYPDFLQAMLDARGYAYRVVNQGISGDTTSGGVERLDAVLAMKPEIVILELGANDGLRGLPLASTRANLDEMIEKLKQGGARVILAGMTLPRNYGPGYIRDFERIFTDLAKKHSAPLIPFFLAGVAESGEHMQADRLHPTAEGNRVVAANVMKTLEPSLKKGEAGQAPH
ncbi:MAG TPA: arylesterase [Bryobacteraceae bacterium]|nr:arylesterase [Bryobacteraceae bacterium]